MMQIHDAEIEAKHIRLLAFGQVAYFYALAAEVDEYGAVACRVSAVGDVVAVRFGAAVEEIDAQSGMLFHRRGDLVEVGYGAHRRRRDEPAGVYAQLGALLFRDRERVQQFVDAARRQLVADEIVRQAEIGSVFEHDLRRVRIAVRFRYGERQTARTYVYDRIFHIPLRSIYFLIFIFSLLYIIS